MRVTKGSEWSKEEDCFLYQYYPNYNSGWISRQLKRSCSATMRRASKLGIVKLKLGSIKVNFDAYSRLLRSNRKVRFSTKARN